MRFLKARLTN